MNHLSRPVLKKAIFLLFGILLILFASLTLYVASYIHAKTDTKADVAIILGAKSYKGTSYNPCLVSRVKTGVVLYTKGQVSNLLFSGGTDREDGKNEAETMKKISLEYGASESAILLETEATSTYENLVNSKKILEDKGLKNVIIVSEPFHIARARLMARSIGINAMYQAASDSPCWTRWKYLSRYFLKEPISILYYVITGKIRL